MCEHNFNYVGVRYYDGKQLLPGTGATRRYYAHVYCCSRCLETRGAQIPDPGGYRPAYTSYYEARFSATPGTAAECQVPLSDR